MYDPAVGRWNGVDPLANRRDWLTPYNYVQNTPLSRIDPNGETDFTLNKETGEVAQVGDKNDEPDRILKTNKNGSIKRKGEGPLGFLVKKENRGKAKVAVNGIEQGILQDGQNFKTESNLIEVGGEGQPSEQGVEAFALKLSTYVGREIGGAYFSKDGVESATHITIGRYEDNAFALTRDNGHNLRIYFNTKKEIDRFSLRGFFHTHPTGAGISKSDRLVPSDNDLRARNNALKINPSLRFFLLTAPVNHGDRYPKKIDYTTGYSFRLR